MALKKETKKTAKGKFREKCGDCFYNGSCDVALNKCMFLKKRHVQED